MSGVRASVAISGVGGIPTYDTDDLPLQRLKEIYASEFEQADTTRLALIVRHYMVDQGLERQSVPSASIATRIGEVRGAASQLLNAIQSGEKGIVQGALQYIDDELQKSPTRSEMIREVKDLQRQLVKLIRACKTASETVDALPASGGLHPGAAGSSWRNFVRQLDQWAKEMSLDRAIGRNDTDKTLGFQPSRYVEMVEAIRLSMPESFRPHSTSLQALRARISAARK